MIKIILCGVWVCAVTLLSSYGAVWWQMRSQPAAAHEPEKATAPSGLESVRTRMISVPIIADGNIQGYVMTQFVVTVDSQVSKRLSVKPDMVFLDEAFKVIYAGEAIDFRHLKKQDLPGLSKTIVENVNKRFGVKAVDDALIQELNYLPKERVRGGPGSSPKL